MPQPTPFEAKTNASFEAVMWAFSYPGRVQNLLLEPHENAFARIADSLLDAETSAHSSDANLEHHLRATGAKIKPLEQAEYVFLPDGFSIGQVDVVALEAAQIGSMLVPEAAAMLIIATAIGSGARLRLSGPGISDLLEVNLDLPLEFLTLRERVLAYPIGWDVLLVDGANVVGLPRTTRIEVI
jgi:alpha-D-ribose 1-methylphosphonate 5-triphosphate synthase subunit PhnH